MAIEVQRIVHDPDMSAAADAQDSFVSSWASIVAVPTVAPSGPTISALLPLLSVSENDNTIVMPSAAVTVEPAAGLDETSSECATAGIAATSHRRMAKAAAMVP